jgi:hypothetical protein
MKRATSDSWNDLEFFTEKGTWKRKPRITITNNDTISFNSAFSYRARLKGKTHVRLAYSPKRRQIIFDFTEDPKAPGSFTLVHKGSNSFSVACRSFFYAHDFDKEEIAGRYEPHRERIPKIGECWLIRLGERVIM